MLNCYYNKLYYSAIHEWGSGIIIIHESPYCEEVTIL